MNTACIIQAHMPHPPQQDLFREASAFHRDGRLEEAKLLYERILSHAPGHADALQMLGVLHHQVGRNRQALELLNRSLALNPANPSAQSNLGLVLAAEGRIDEAADAFRTALDHAPGLFDAHNNLGNALKDTGLLTEAIDHYRRAQLSRPHPRAASNLLIALNYHPDYDPARVREEHERWNRSYAQGVPRTTRHSNASLPDRRIRIGYVSPHFRDIWFLSPLLSHHHRDSFEVICYSDGGLPDSMSGRLAAHADAWRSTAGLSDQQVADLIAKDGIDVLVDLALHSSGGRPLLFARKPAPIQINWLGYPGTSGLHEMDYRVSDPHLDPPGIDESVYFEKTIRLPESYWCYDPIVDQPPVNALPAARNGFITFGCLNAFCKITPPTLRLWAEVLNANPSSRVVVLAPRGSARQRLLASLGAQGVEAARIGFVDRQPRDRYLEQYGQIDIGIDTIPCPGHTTTLDSLWMGVPVITLPGATAVSRAGVSILTNIGLQSLIAKDVADYVALSVRLSADQRGLSGIRQQLRGRLSRSPLMDGERFTRNMEAIYRQVWRNWCHRQTAGNDQ